MPQHLVSMAMSPQENKSLLEEPEDSGPRFPFGLEIHLNEETLAKLGITEMPAVGAKIEIHAFAFVSSVSENQRIQDDGAIDSNQHVDLQITDIGLSQNVDANLGERMFDGDN